MNIETAKPWRIQNRLRQEKTIGHDDSRIGVEISKGFLLVSGFQRQRRPDLNALCRRIVLHRRGPHTMSPPGGPWRLRIDGNNLMPCRD